MVACITRIQSPLDICILLNKILSQLSKWFSTNKLSLNLDKTRSIKFVTKNSQHISINTGYNDKYTEVVVNTKFLGLKLISLELAKSYQSVASKIIGALLDNMGLSAPHNPVGLHSLLQG
jgi:hypothetical protein